jgi:hypothetical protein
MIATMSLRLMTRDSRVVSPPSAGSAIFSLPATSPSALVSL